MKNSSLRGAVGFAHLALQQYLNPGDRVVDATCGNGRDTLFLARLVGPTGHVWGIDIQAAAISATRTLLANAGCLSRVTLVETGHESMAATVSEQVQGVVFNLGYLPGGERSLVTMPPTTLQALNQATALLVPGGIITIAIYTGHPGGASESAAVQEWAANLPESDFSSWHCRQLNRAKDSPSLILVEKLQGNSQRGIG